MIPVIPAPEPTTFDARVRQPGLSAIDELVGRPPRLVRPGRGRKQLLIDGSPITREDQIPARAFPDFWTRILPELHAAYKGLCAYLAVYIERVTGARSVDHMVPKSRSWTVVYEWTNYRLACSWMNAHKNDAPDVLDPFLIGDDWFQLELVGFQVLPGATLSLAVRRQVQETIDRLDLNDHECRKLRTAYAEAYSTGDISWTYLVRRAPFVARELDRQGQRRPENP